MSKTIEEKREYLNYPKITKKKFVDLLFGRYGRNIEQSTKTIYYIDGKPIAEWCSAGGSIIIK